MQLDVAENGVGNDKPSLHYKIAHPAAAEILTVPFKRPMKPVYVRKLVAFIDAVRSAE